MNRRPGLPPAVAAEVERLQEQMGLPREVALRVAREEITLNQVLEDMASRDRADMLMRRHGLDRALATQIAKGQADLERVLTRRRLASHLALNADRSCLVDAHKEGRAWRFSLLGQRQVTARVVELDQYEVSLHAAGAEEPEAIHKLQFKLAWRPEQDKQVRRGFRTDKALRASPRDPASRPQDRYGCSNRRLFGWMEAETPISVTTLEGDIVQGAVSWFGRYEFGITVKGKAEVVVFRHALAQVCERR